MLATFKRVRTISQRVQLIASIVVLVLLFLLSSLVLSSRLHAGTSVSSTGGATSSAQTSTGPDPRDEHPQRQWRAMHQQPSSPAGCVPVATNGRGHVPAAGAGSC
jgi:hypothetical protein